jgi:hypothetical protein
MVVENQVYADVDATGLRQRTITSVQTIWPVIQYRLAEIVCVGTDLELVRFPTSIEPF